MSQLSVSDRSPRLREQSDHDLMAKLPAAALVRQTVANARAGVEVTLHHRQEAVHWPSIEDWISYAVSRPPTARQRVVARAERVLRTADPLEDRAIKYRDVLDAHVRWTESWRPMVPEGQLPAILDELLMWQTAWHLLAANVPLTDIIAIFAASRPKARPPKPTRADKARAAWAYAGAFVRQSAINMANPVYAVVRRVRASRDQAKHERDAMIAAASARVEAAQKDAAERVAKAESDHQARVVQKSTEAANQDSQSLQINGPALHGSVFGTWLMLVVLSWVSLFWGALISAPIGIGFGIMATAVAGIFVVPLWATFWGFVGMRFAHDRTLKQMGFEDVGADTGLSQVTSAYAAQLGLPPPRVGTVPAFNAFAVGLDRANATVAIGKPLIEQLTDAELRAVIGHELGHIASGDMRRMMLMRTFQNATVWFGLAQGLKQAARWVICWAAEIAILAFSRKREYWADAVGAALAGTDAMIGALRKLDTAPPLTSAENTHARFMFRGRPLSTHPSIEQRIVALEAGTFVNRLPLTRQP